MSFKRDDVITFEDGSKVIAIDVILHNGKEYLFVNELANDTMDLTDKYKVLVADYQNGNLNNVVDTNLLAELMPIFEMNIEDTPAGQ